MNELTTAASDEITRLATTYEAMPTAEIVSALTHELRVTAERIVRIAAMVKVLEARGVDLSRLKLAMIDHLRKVARGDLLPAVLVEFQERPLLLEKVSALPVSDQEHIAAGGTVAVLAVDPAGQVQRVEKRAEELSRREVHQVFFRGRIRPTGEQLEWMKENEPTPQAREPDIEVDRDRGGVRVGDQFLTARELKQFLNELEG